MAVFIINFSKLLLYFIICASLAIIMRTLIKIPEEFFRKFLHFILLGSAPVLLKVFDTWYTAVLASLFFALLVYPALSFAEKQENYSKILVERKSGEIKKSLLYVFGMFAIVFTISWGIMDAKYIALTVILAWGLGDAAAALVGKKLGHRQLKWKYADQKKTLEGSLAMFALSFLVICIILFINTEYLWYKIFFISLIMSVVNAIVEMITKNGLDTITCPLALISLMVIFLYFMG